MKPGRVGTMTHDYKRHGTTTLSRPSTSSTAPSSAVTCSATGTSSSSLPQRRRSASAEGKRSTPSSTITTHKHPKVHRGRLWHRRWTFHFTPTSASWLNAVEGFFAKLTKRRLKRGVFVSVVDLQAAINRFVVEHNAEPNPSHGPPIPTKLSRLSDGAPSVRFDPLVTTALALFTQRQHRALFVRRDYWIARSSRAMTCVVLEAGSSAR